MKEIERLINDFANIVFKEIEVFKIVLGLLGILITVNFLISLFIITDMISENKKEIKTLQELILKENQNDR